MYRRTIRSTCALFGAVAIAVVAACSDSTAPISRRIPGTYELTTVLDTYSYPSDCVLTNNGLSCTTVVTVPAGASKLYGTFTVGDSINGTSRELNFPVTNIVFHQADCALSSGPCTEASTAWYSGGLTLKRDSLTVYGQLSGQVQLYFTGRLDDDRFVGTITWMTYVGCCGVRYYSGTFVARRQR